MKKMAKIALFIAGAVLFCALLVWAGEFQRAECETRVAKELSTTAVYVNGHCMVKGYGRFDGG
jgi:hypothetical protein